jgi:chromosomal replication initiator protein
MMVAVWQAALPRLREELGERNFATWIEPIRCTADDDGLRLEVANQFFQDWVTRHYLATIRTALCQHMLDVPPVRVVVASRQTNEPAAATPVPVEPAPAPEPRRARIRVKRTPRIGRLVEEYTFGAFVVGPTNELAYRAARSVTGSSGRRFNPLFVWGGVGLGKTHLTSAIAHEALAQEQPLQVAYLSAEAFTNALITSLRNDQMVAFRDRFREVDLLILDDIEFLSGKERTQEELFHTFNTLYSAGKQVVLTSDKPPHVIGGIEHRLRSRFEGGLIVDIHPPTRDMRLAILKNKAKAQNVDVPDDVAQLIVDRCGTSVRELEGALTRVVAWSTLRKQPIDLASAIQTLAPVTRPLRVSVSVDTVLDRVSRHFGVTVDELKSHQRARSLAAARQVAMYLSRTLAAASFPSIADKFGGRDHSTVMYAVRTVERRRVDDPELSLLLGALERELREQPRP